MNSAARLVLVLWLALCGWIPRLQGQAGPIYEGYLWMDGMKGESTAAHHEDWITIQEVSFGVQQSSASDEPSQLSDLQVTKQVDRATPRLFAYCASGKSIPKVILEWVQGVQDRQRFFQIELEEVTFASVSSRAGLETDPRPMENISLSYQRIRWIYTELGMKGEPRQEQVARWDVAKEQGNTYAEALHLKVVARLSADGNMRLSWPTDPDQGYRILAGDSITGPFSELRVVPASETGSVSQTVTINGPARFFIVEKLDQ